MTQEELKKLLYYDPDTGIFTWLVQANNRFKVGSEAGTINKNLKTGKSYIDIKIRGKVYYNAGKLAFLYMTGKFPEDQVDHINGNGIDNRWNNIRKVTRLVNSQNRRKYANNSSGVVGVRWYCRVNKWASGINVNKKAIHLGYFNDFTDAVRARRLAEIQYGFHQNHGSSRPL